MSNRQVFLILGSIMVALGLAMILITKGYMERQAELQQEQARLEAEVQKTRAAEEQKKAEKARQQAEMERKAAAQAEKEMLAERRKLEEEEAARKEEEERRKARRRAEEERRAAKKQAEAKANFERLRGGTPTNFVASIQGRVVSFGFFQHWRGMLMGSGPEGVLGNHFRRSPEMVLGWQVTFEHPAFNMPVILPLTILLYSDDGTVIDRRDDQHQIMPGWTVSWKKDAGTVPTVRLEKGRYWVNLYHDGVKIAESSLYLD